MARGKGAGANADIQMHLSMFNFISAPGSKRHNGDTPHYNLYVHLMFANVTIPPYIGM